MLLLEPTLLYLGSVLWFSSDASWDLLASLGVAWLWLDVLLRPWLSRRTLEVQTWFLGALILIVLSSWGPVDFFFGKRFWQISFSWLSSLWFAARRGAQISWWRFLSVAVEGLLVATLLIPYFAFRLRKKSSWIGSSSGTLWICTLLSLSAVVWFGLPVYQYGFLIVYMLLTVLFPVHADIIAEERQLYHFQSRNSTDHDDDSFFESDMDVSEEPFRTRWRYWKDARVLLLAWYFLLNEHVDSWTFQTNVHSFVSSYCECLGSMDYWINLPWLSIFLIVSGMYVLMHVAQQAVRLSQLEDTDWWADLNWIVSQYLEWLDDLWQLDGFFVSIAQFEADDADLVFLDSDYDVWQIRVWVRSKRTLTSIWNRVLYFSIAIPIWIVAFLYVGVRLIWSYLTPGSNVDNPHNRPSVVSWFFLSIVAFIYRSFISFLSVLTVGTLFRIACSVALLQTSGHVSIFPKDGLLSLFSSKQTHSSMTLLQSARTIFFSWLPSLNFFRLVVSTPTENPDAINLEDTALYSDQLSRSVNGYWVIFLVILEFLQQRVPRVLRWPSVSQDTSDDDFYKED